MAARNRRPFPAEARANDLIHWQTRLRTHDIEVVDQQIRASGLAYISPGVVTRSDDSPGLRRGLLVGDPDGHALQLVKK